MPYSFFFFFLGVYAYRGLAAYEIIVEEITFDFPAVPPPPPRFNEDDNLVELSNVCKKILKIYCIIHISKEQRSSLNSLFCTFKKYLFL